MPPLDSPTKGFQPFRNPFGATRVGFPFAGVTAHGGCAATHTSSTSRRWARGGQGWPAMAPLCSSKRQALPSPGRRSRGGERSHRQPCCGGRPAKACSVAILRSALGVRGPRPQLRPPGGFWFFSPRRKEHPQVGSSLAHFQASRLANNIPERPSNAKVDGCSFEGARHTVGTPQCGIAAKKATACSSRFLLIRPFGLPSARPGGRWASSARIRPRGAYRARPGWDP